MSAHVLLKVVNEMKKIDQMRGLSSYINSITQEHSCWILFIFLFIFPTVYPTIYLPK